MVPSPLGMLPLKPLPQLFNKAHLDNMLRAPELRELCDIFHSKSGPFAGFRFPSK
jgi:hypothetical protein